MLICHSSFRGVVELLGDVFDYPIALGTVHNIVHSAVAQARRINQQYDLSTIIIGLHDQIFQASDPVLVGVDATLTFCYLLSLEDHRDAETWGIRLLKLVDHGFAPTATVTDGDSGLRAGQKLALPEVPCRGDHFHLWRDFEAAVNHLERRASPRSKPASSGNVSGGIRAGVANLSWRSPVGAPAPPSGSLGNRLRQRSRRQYSITTPSIQFSIAPCGFHGGQRQHSLRRPTHPLMLAP